MKVTIRLMNDNVDEEVEFPAAPLVGDIIYNVVGRACVRVHERCWDSFIT